MSRVIPTVTILVILASGLFAQTVATVNGRIVTQSEVDLTDSRELIILEQQVYALRRAALENYITRIVLEDEAKRRGISVEALKRELTNVPVSVSADDVAKAFSENKSAFAQMSPDEAKERIRLDMETQARMRNYRGAVAKLKAESKITASLRPPVLMVSGEKFATGKKDARVTIV